MGAHVRQMLVRLGALNEEEETITSLGRHLAAFPIAPRFAKMLVLGHQVCLDLDSLRANLSC